MFRLIYKISDYFGDKLNILILSPNYRSFGNSIEEIFFGLLHCHDKGKKLLLIKPFNNFFFKKINISNEYLYEIEHDLLLKPNFIVNFFLSLMMTLMASVGYLDSKARLIIASIFGFDSNFFSNKELSYNSLQHFGRKLLWGFSEEEPYSKEKWESLENEYSAPRLPYSLIQKSKKFVEDNFPEVHDKDWVTLHVLDNTLTRYARGADINSYYSAVEYLINKGFTVFRMGDSSMPKCFKFKGLIDLAHIKHENFLDLYLVKNASFHIGVGSGPNYLTHLFKKDLLVTNLTEWSTSLPRKKGNFFILKNLYKKSTKEKIAISKLFTKGFDYQINTNFYEDRDLLLKDNTSDEILSVLKDFMEFIDSESSYSKLQTKFDKAKNAWLKHELIDNNADITYSSDKEKDLQRVRSIALSTLNGTMGHSYLKENWEIENNDI